MIKSSYTIFSGTSHPLLAKEIADNLGISLGKVRLNVFPDGEIGVQILESVQNQDVFVVQSLAHRPNFYYMELLILIDALRRASAGSIIAVLPYYGYSRQDRRDASTNMPITAKLMANLLEEAGVNRVITIDLHRDQIQGFFDIAIENLHSRHVFINALQYQLSENLIVVSPDMGSVELAKDFGRDLMTDIAVIHKKRVGNSVVVENIIGNVTGKSVLLVDDIWSTGATVWEAAKACKLAGAVRIIVAVIHGLFIDEIYEEGVIDMIFVSNTVPLQRKLSHIKIQIISISELLSLAMKSMIRDNRHEFDHPIDELHKNDLHVQRG